MKSIILSVKPYEAMNILNGEQTIIIKKTAPKETPFKVYLYCTKGGQRLKEAYYSNRKPHKRMFYLANGIRNNQINLNGKVVAEFVCSGVSEYIAEFSKDDNDYQGIKQILRDEDDMPDEVSYATTIISNFYDNPNDCILLERANMSFDDVKKYCKYKDSTIYGLHITNLKIYDEPKELDNFTGVLNQANGAISRLVESYEKQIKELQTENAELKAKEKGK